MQSIIECKTMFDIVKKWGFPTELYEFESTYKYNCSEEDINRFKSEIIEISKPNRRSSKKTFENYVKIIGKNEKIFDKEVYLLHVARLLEKDYIEQYNSEENLEYESRIFLDSEFSDMAKKVLLIRNAKTILKDLDIVDVKIKDNMKLNIFSSFEFTNLPQIVKEKNKKTKEKLDFLNGKNIFKQILDMYTLDEFFDSNLGICKYNNLSYILKNIIKESENEEQTFLEIISKYINYIDIDKLLVLSTNKLYEKLDKKIENIPYNQINELKDFTDIISTIVSNKDAEVLINDVSKISFIKIKEDIDRIFSCFIKEKYCDEQEKYNIVKKLINGELDIFSFSKNDFINLKFYQTEISEMIKKNPISIQFIFKNDLENKRELKKRIESQNRIISKQLYFAISSNILNFKDILNLYYKDKIKILDLKENKELINKKFDLSDLFSAQELIKTILNKNTEKTQKYILLYKIWCMDGKSDSEISNISNQILDYVLDLLDENQIIELYHIGIISLHSLLETFNNKEEGFIILFNNNVVKPLDIRNLYYNNKITNEDFKNLLEKKDEKEKISIICSIFPNSNDIKQLETRDILLQDISDNARAIYGKSAEINKSYFNQKDNCLKWNTISNIDEDFIQRYLNNGNVIFYLPNKFEYIIEKIFKNSVKPTYGNAVYILNKEDFKKYENDIIDSKTKEINNTLLLKLSNEKNNSIKKVVNTGWSYLTENI